MKWTAAQDTKLIHLYSKGAKFREIALELGLADATLSVARRCYALASLGRMERQIRYRSHTKRRT